MTDVTCEIIDNGRRGIYISDDVQTEELFERNKWTERKFQNGWISAVSNLWHRNVEFEF